MSPLPHAASLEGCFPELAGDAKRVESVGDGWDCAVTAIDRELIVRIPRRAEVQAALHVETRLLAELVPVVPVPVPSPERVCSIHGSMVYRRIGGHGLTERTLEAAGVETVAQQIAAMLSAVWTFPVERAEALGVGGRNLEPVLSHFRWQVAPLIDDSRAIRLLDEAHERLLDVDRPVLIHADIGPAHLLCHDGGLVGIIDWSDASIGDRATDLGWLLNGSRRRLRSPLLDQLQIDRSIVARADLYHRLGPWWEVLHGLDHDRPDLVGSGLRGARARLPR